MYSPGIHTGSQTLLEMGEFLLARLKAADGMRDLMPAVREADRQLRQAEDHLEATHGAVLTSLALRDAADGEADDLLRRFFGRIEEVTGKKGGGKQGRLYFPEGLGWLINTPILHQPAEMRLVIGRLDREKNEELKAFSPMLFEAAGTLEQYNENYQGAIRQAEAAYGVVLHGRAAWIRTYDKVYGELAVRVGKRDAEAFFQKVQRPRRRTMTGSRRKTKT